MPLTTRPVVVGVQARFFRDGAAFTVPSAGTAGRAALPGVADTGWIDLGVINEGTINTESDVIEIFAPQPGRKVLHDIIQTKNKLTINLTLQELSPLAFELVFKTAALTGSSTTYNPLSLMDKKGWLELKLADQGDTVVTVSHFFVYLKTGGEWSLGDGLASVPLEAHVLASSLDAGSVGPVPE